MRKRILNLLTRYSAKLCYQKKVLLADMSNLHFTPKIKYFFFIL